MSLFVGGGGVGGGIVIVVGGGFVGHCHVTVGLGAPFSGPPSSDKYGSLMCHEIFIRTLVSRNFTAQSNYLHYKY